LTLAMVVVLYDVENEEDDEVEETDVEGEEEDDVTTEEVDVDEEVEDDELGEVVCVVLVDVLVLELVTVDTVVRVARYAPPAKITIITTTTITSTVRETPPLFKDLSCKLVASPEFRYLKLATKYVLELASTQ